MAGTGACGTVLGMCTTSNLYCGFRFPAARITVNLAPADRRKAGTVYDLPMLVGILAALVDGGFVGAARRVASADSFIPLGPAAGHVLVAEDGIVAGVRRLLAGPDRP